MVAHWDTHPACKGERRARKPGPPRKRERKAFAAVLAEIPAHHDMTLDELETANLDAILAAAGATYRKEQS
jgi:hypothetical protein